MNQALKRLGAMRRNPSGDWTIADIESVCDACGVEFLRSRAGSSHYQVKHPAVADILTIPFARPVKAVYIRKLVRFIDSIAEGTE